MQVSYVGLPSDTTATGYGPISPMLVCEGSLK